MKFLFSFGVILGAILLFGNLFGGGSASQSSDAPKFRQVGYLKDGVNNRIFTFRIPVSASTNAVRGHAAQLPNTAGQMTAAYYYPEGSVIPADGVTLAGDILEANRVLYETPGLSPWRYAYMRSYNGKVGFYDCEATPKGDLCMGK